MGSCYVGSRVLSSAREAAAAGITVSPFLVAHSLESWSDASRQRVEVFGSMGFGEEEWRGSRYVESRVLEGRERLFQLAVLCHLKWWLILLKYGLTPSG